MIGEKYGRLTVLEEIALNKRCCWKCKCDCGNEVMVKKYDLINGRQKSCGCLSSENTIKRNELQSIVGEKFGRLRVIEKVGYAITKSGRRRSIWRCLCECGKETIVTRNNLTTNNTESCGCKKTEMTIAHNKTQWQSANSVHGMSNTKFYKVWQAVKGRCLLKTHRHYPSYGGRGIKICEEWLDFEKFKSDMHSSYEEAINIYGDGNVSLERTNNDEGYNVNNCCWIRRGEQIKNRRHSMNFNYYQKEAKKSALYPFAGNNMCYVALGLASEAGEVCGVVKKVIRDKNHTITDEVREKLIDELGDVLWYIAASCSELNVSMTEIARRNIDKLKSRMERNVIGGSGDNR